MVTLYCAHIQYAGVGKYVDYVEILIQDMFSYGITAALNINMQPPVNNFPDSVYAYTHTNTHTHLHIHTHKHTHTYSGLKLRI